MEIFAFFHGIYLNAVDAKGRVSLPSQMRDVIARRARLAAATFGEGLDDKLLHIGRHPAGGRLKAFDDSYSKKLQAQVEETIAELPAAEKAVARERELERLFAPNQPVSFDAGGRMVLSPQLRRRGGIEDLALFVAAGEFMQIWNPQKFLADPDQLDSLKEDVRDALAERGVAA